jgi:ubiquinone/menaquinone biosynthesis C-methylase UbiE
VGEALVGQIDFDESMVRRLEGLYRTGDMLRRRRLVHDALGASRGERGLDVGCGPGFYVRELLDAVGTEGSVVGVDNSADSLAAAEHRCAGHANVAFHEAEATALPVPSGSFDAARPPSSIRSRTAGRSCRCWSSSS